MSDDVRFAVTFGEDVDAALAGLRARPGTRRLAGALARAVREQVQAALAAGPNRAAPWRALWLAISEVVALGGGDPDALARLRAFLEENADLVAPALVFDRVVSVGGRVLLTYAPPVPPAIAAAAVAPNRYTEWIYGAWSVAAMIAGVALAVRALS